MLTSAIEWNMAMSLRGETCRSNIVWFQWLSMPSSAWRRLRSLAPINGKRLLILFYQHPSSQSVTSYLIHWLDHKPQKSHSWEHLYSSEQHVASYHPNSRMKYLKCFYILLCRRHECINIHIPPAERMSEKIASAFASECINLCMFCVSWRAWPFLHR